MIDLSKAKKVFQEYISHYDVTIPSIRLKIIHTYEVIKCSEYLCDKLYLTQEDKNLASLIALLHDIGRFEQWIRYESFADYKTIDHALFSSQLLFDKGMIRLFIEDDCYDNVIKNAIEQHNKYKIDEGFDERELLFIHLIRDADKLDNFRVKEEERIEDILFKSIDEVNLCVISDAVYQQMFNQQLVYAPNRKTSLDMWLSYIAFIYDLHYSESINFIKENNWIHRSFDRLSPLDEETKKKYLILKQKALEYIERRAYEKQ